MVEYTGTSPTDSSGGSLDVHKSAWTRTLEEMDALEDELTAEGWDVVSFPAGHTGPQVPDDGDDDRFGLTHVIPGNKVEPFREAYEAGSFEDYRVFQNEVMGRYFLLTAIQDVPTETAILVAGNYERRRGQPLVRVARERDEMYTHVRRLDGTYVGTFEHEDYRHFFPNADDSTE